MRYLHLMTLKCFPSAAFRGFSLKPVTGNGSEWNGRLNTGALAIPDEDHMDETAAWLKRFAQGVGWTARMPGEE